MLKASCSTGLRGVISTLFVLGNQDGSHMTHLKSLSSMGVAVKR